MEICEYNKHFLSLKFLFKVSIKWQNFKYTE